MPIDDGVIEKAYQTTQFYTKVISVGQINESYNILFTCDLPDRYEHSTCIIKRRRKNDIVQSVEI